MRKASVRLASPLDQPYSERSCFVFGLHNPVRRTVFRIVEHPHFHNFVMFCIVTNAISIGSLDYSVVNAAGEPTIEERGKYSWRNAFFAYSDPVFIAFFTLEMVMKMMAYGVWQGKYSYLRKGWNVFDCTIVLGSLLSLIDSMPKVTFLRSARILRSLRTLNQLPKLRCLVETLLSSIMPLANVLLLLAFVITICGILALEGWGVQGALRSRCRLTSEPLKMPANVIGRDAMAIVYSNYTGMPQCRSDAGVDDLWPEEQDCFWPIDKDQHFLCDRDESFSTGLCRSGTYCGSDWDARANRRFANEYIMRASLYHEDFNWGYATFGNIGSTFLIMIQIVTLEGWTKLWTLVADGYNYITAGVFFVCMFFVCALLKNLAVGAIWESFFMLERTRGGGSDEHQYAAIFKLLDWDHSSTLESFQVLAKVGHLTDERHQMSSHEYAAIAKDLGLELPITFTDFCSILNEEERQLIERAEHKKEAKAMRKQEAKDALRAPTRPWICLKCREIVESTTFDIMVIVIVIFWVLVLALEEYPDDPTWVDQTENLSLLFTIIFSIEMLIKMLGLGVKGYFHEKFNRFDFVIIVAAWTEICMFVPPIISGKSHSATDSQPSAAMLRVFRLFKMLRVADITQIPSLKHFVQVLTATLISVGYFWILFALVLFIFALFGQQLFANTFHFDANGYVIERGEPGYETAFIPRCNYDNFVIALLSVTKVATLDSWYQQMFDARRATNSSASLFYVMSIIVTHFLLINVLVGLMLNEFRAKNKSDARKNGEAFVRESMKPGFAEKSMKDLAEVRDDYDRWHALHQTRAVYRLVGDKRFQRLIVTCIVASSLALVVDNPLRDPDELSTKLLYVFDVIVVGVFALEMVLKIAALGLVHHKRAYLRDPWNILDGIIVITSLLGLILGGQGEAGIELQSLRALRVMRALRPLRMIRRFPGMRKVTIALMNSFSSIGHIMMLMFLTNIVFAITLVHWKKGTFYECKGNVWDTLPPEKQEFITHPPKDWVDFTEEQKAWNPAEYATHDSTYTYSLGGNSTGTGNSTSTRMLLAGGGEWVGASGDSAHAHRMLAGGPTGLTSAMMCSYLNATWQHSAPYNFNNVPNAMLALFTIMTLEDWTNIVFTTVDSTTIGMQPIRGHFELWVYYYLLFVLICGLFMVSLFVGVLVDHFDKQEKHSSFLTKEQQKWVQVRKEMLQGVPPTPFLRPSHPLRAKCYDICAPMKLRDANLGEPSNDLKWANQIFEFLVFFAIALNTLLLMCSHFGMEQAAKDVLSGFSILFLVVFNIEAAIRIAGLGRAYFRDSWNMFDFWLVAVSNAGFIVDTILHSDFATLGIACRALRVLRVLRLVKHMRQLRIFFNTLLLSVPALCNVALLMLLMVYVFACIGIQLFAKVKLGDALNEDRSFQSFYRAVRTLLTTSTGEGWQYLMYDLANKEDCVSNPPYNPGMCGFSQYSSSARFDGSSSQACVPINGCGSDLAYVYFPVFVITIIWLAMNLFVAIIIQGSDQAFMIEMRKEDKHNGGTALSTETQVTPAQFQEFFKSWMAQDKKMTKFVTPLELFDVLAVVDKPLGFGLINSDTQHMSSLHKISEIEALHIHQDARADGLFYIEDVLVALAVRVLEVDMDERKVRELEHDISALESEEYAHVRPDLHDEHESRARAMRFKQHHRAKSRLVVGAGGLGSMARTTAERMHRHTSHHRASKLGEVGRELSNRNTPQHAVGSVVQGAASTAGAVQGSVVYMGKPDEATAATTDGKDMVASAMRVLV